MISPPPTDSLPQRIARHAGWPTLFICAYALFMVSMRPMHDDIAAVEHVLDTKRAATPVAHSESPASPQADTAASIVVPAPSPAAKSISTANATKPRASATELETAQQLAIRATQGEDAQDRGAAIGALAAIAAPISIDTLASILRDSEDRRDRLRAADALGKMALQANADSRIAEILRAASDDPDTNVAAHAREAYRRVSQ